ncbi:hypothetical protein AAF712_010885 [Marasmius tenuissimus]|uniref:Uncharacterized protein n=1 Tax=Marasmius tenuissimus TaxID=585030 RepID=A0ABR2ZLX8_9AGAR
MTPPPDSPSPGSAPSINVENISNDEHDNGSFHTCEASSATTLLNPDCCDSPSDNPPPLIEDDPPSLNEDSNNAPGVSDFYSSEEERLEAETSAYIASVCSAIQGVPREGLAKIDPYRMIILYDVMKETINVIYVSKLDKCSDYEKVEQAWVECSQVIFSHLEPTIIDTHSLDLA